MNYKITIFKLFILLFLPFLVFAQDNDIKKSVDEHLDEQMLVALKVVENIKKEKYLSLPINEREYDKQINYLLNKIAINQREGNFVAVKRDEINLQILQEKREYEKTLKEIIQAKNSYKDKDYFKRILKENISLLETNSITKYKEIYEKAKKDKGNQVSLELIDSYTTLKKQKNKQHFVLKYLLGNMDEYRESYFFIDNFNIDYIISKIDSQPMISNISQFTSYYFKFSIGEVLFVIFVMGFFRIINTKLIFLFTTFINKIFMKRSDKEEDEMELFIKDSIEKPLIFALYTLSIHISLYALIKDTEAINTIVPWINTIYIGILTWAVYALLDNWISNYAENLVEKYPNVRREMIAFILRITKVVLILLVILFLFTQLGIDIKAIAASLGVGGIAIALASKDTLANFFGSLNIMTDNSFSQGDWIIANDVEGTVVDIRMRTTRVRTFDNAMITIPNSELATTHIKNYSKRKIGRRIKMSIGVTYESSMSDVKNLKEDIREMLINHPDIATINNSIVGRTRRFESAKREDLQGVKRTLLVYIDEFDNSSVNILVYCFTRSPDWEEWLRVKEDVIMKISELVDKNNCEFAYPTQTLFVKK
ncbi:mechanosensitive ion channel family protein [Halarcobacter sp.]|uniref:mechanosensitive ion channel family protein n=1 Tax=Halarcobacter sp. TaxID=2321133 RepID=UPI003A8EAEAE